MSQHGNKSKQDSTGNQPDESFVATAEFFPAGEQVTEIAGNIAEEKRTITGNEKTLNLQVDGVPYLVKASPFAFNGETRYYVSINDGPDHVFTWDSEVGQLRAIDDDAAELPDTLEEAISRKLQSLQK
ncbi:MAG: hypothetical protein ABW019_09335 [Chitinophagaceae bacterium]